MVGNARSIRIWSEQSITFPSPHCKENCRIEPSITYGSAIPNNALEAAPSTPDKECNVEMVSAKEFNKLTLKKDHQVGVAFIQQLREDNSLTLSSMDSIHEQVYPFLDPHEIFDPRTLSKDDILRSNAPMEEIIGKSSIRINDPKLQDPFVKRFAKVFNEANADKLPVRRPYDMEINLEPNAKIPHTKLYNLSPKENKAMEEYIRPS